MAATVRGRRLNYSKLSQFLSVPFFRWALLSVPGPTSITLCTQVPLKRGSFAWRPLTSMKRKYSTWKEMLVSFWFAEKMKRWEIEKKSTTYENEVSDDTCNGISLHFSNSRCEPFLLFCFLRVMTGAGASEGRSTVRQWALFLFPDWNCDDGNVARENERVALIERESRLILSSGPCDGRIGLMPATAAAWRSRRRLLAIGVMADNGPTFVIGILECQLSDIVKRRIIALKVLK